MAAVRRMALPRDEAVRHGAAWSDGVATWRTGHFGPRSDAALHAGGYHDETSHWWESPPAEAADTPAGLWPHQREALVSLCGRGRVPAHRAGWNMPLGAGKTRAAIEAARLWRAANPGRGPVVVVCPLAVWWGWTRNLERWWPDAVIGAAKGWHTPVTRGWERAERAAARRRIVDLPSDSAVDVVLTHWLAGDAAWRVAADAGAAVVILDEVHSAKSLSSRSHRRVRAAWSHGAPGSPGLLIGLSGTPMGQRPPELFGTQRLIDPSVFGWSPAAHADRYFVRNEAATRAAGHPIPSAEFRDDEARRRWMDRGALSWLVVSPESIARDWTPTVWEAVSVDIGGHATDGATMAREGVWPLADPVLIAENPLARRTYRHQLESGLPQREAAADDRLTPKMVALAEMLDAQRDRCPIVVWCLWHHTMDMVAEVATGLGLRAGEISGRTRSGLGPDGRTMPGVGVVVCQVAAASEGIELTEAELAIWVDLPTSLTAWRQAVGRTDRPDERRPGRHPVGVVMLGGLVDRVIWSALRDGDALQRDITVDLEQILRDRLDSPTEQGVS